MSGPKVLFLDIETSPTFPAVWSQKPHFISNDMVFIWTRMICFAAKWKGDKRTIFFSDFDFSLEEHPPLIELWDPNYRPPKHAAMVQAAWDLLDTADILVTYNGDGFDIPHLYREFEEAGLTPPSPFASVDLYKAAKKARWFSNKLQHVSTQLGLGGKAETGGFKLWHDCLSGDPKAWRRMAKYNRRDVVQNEELYNRILPWISAHPHVGLYRDPSVNSCANCGSDDLKPRGYSYTKISVYPRFCCGNCGKWSKGARREAGVDARGVS